MTLPLLLLLLADLPQLQVQLESPKPAERFAAAVAIGELGADGKPALKELIDRIGDEELYVRLAAGRAIVRVGIREKDISALIERLELVPPEVAWLLAEALAQHPKSIGPLMEALSAKGSKRLHRDLARALFLAGPRAAPALPLLLDRAVAKDAALRDIARDAIRRLSPWAVTCVPELTERIASEHADVRWIAVRLLTLAGPAAQSAIPALRKAAGGPDERLAKAARVALESIDVVASANTLTALLNPKSANERAPAKFRVRMETSQGVIVLELERALAPRGVDRFYNLVKLGYFDGCRFFRVMPSFIVQFGLTGNPKVNSAWRQATIEDDQVKGKNTRGTICFAMAGPNTRTTQMFLNLGNNPELDKKGFAPFGKVVKGLELLDKLYAGYRERPSQELITYEGNSYLKREFPKLDWMDRVTLVTK
jgi:peptidyl-prolyl cis-trans isomerase A (cyclophilin A)